MSLFDLRGKVCLVTGSSRGIGKAMVMRLAEHGAKVVVSSRKLEACEAVAAQINDAGHDGQAIALACNVGDKAQLQSLVDQTRAAFGRIDVLICNAATNPSFGPMSGIADAAFDKIIATNLRSSHWLCQMVLPDMVDRKDGVIIFLASVVGLRGNDVIGTYGISKAALMQMARNLALENGPHNIRVNAIAPGLIKTDFARALWENPVSYERSVAGTPLRRIGEPDEIAGAAVFLASAAGAFITGQTIVIDGGVITASAI